MCVTDSLIPSEKLKIAGFSSTNKTERGEEELTTIQKPSISFILSLIGGLIILVGSLVNIVWYALGSSTLGPYGGMMGGYHGMMGNFGVSNSYMTAFSVVGLVCGTVVVIGAIMLNTRPTEHSTWGVLILVFSAISLIGMGGWFVGAFLGIIGGAFALSWRPA